MGIGLAIVISTAIVSFCAMITTIAVVGIKHGHKYIPYKDLDKKKDKDSK